MNEAVPVLIEPITKRELFAAMAMQGILANEQAHPLGMAGEKGAASIAVVLADALLVALSRPSGNNVTK